MKSTLLFLALVPLVVARAQVDTTLHAGDRLRLLAVDSTDTTNIQHLVRPSGTLVGIQDAAFLLRGGAGSSSPTPIIRTPIANVVLAERYAGRKRHVRFGALVGVGVGAIVGYLSASGGGLAAMQCVTIGGAPFCQPTRGLPDRRPAGAAIVGATGAILGAAIGYLARTEQWKPINLAGLKVQIVSP
ncbi:MAG TPA: hypothetical protein VF483_06875 [Gemmatimonadaceae bacterium]